MFERLLDGRNAIRSRWARWRYLALTGRWIAWAKNSTMVAEFFPREKSSHRWPMRISEAMFDYCFGYPGRFVHIEHPKCGRSWLRFMIAVAEAEAYGLPVYNQLYEIPCRRHSLPRVRYYHLLPSLDELEKNESEGILFMIRDPARVMISYYHDCVYREQIFQGTMDEFLHHPEFGILQYVEFVDEVTAFLRKCDLPSMIVKYEDLLENPRDTFREVLRFIDLSFSEESLQRIVDFATIENLQKVSEVDGIEKLGWMGPSSADPRARKFRAGNTESVEDYLSEEQIDFVYEVASRSEAFREFGYIGTENQSTASHD